MNKSRGILSLIGGFGLHLTLGTLYCFGNMNTYMTSYMRKHVHTNIVYNDMIWVLTFATVGQGGFMTLGGYIEAAIGIRPTVLLGSAIMTSGVYLTYFAIQSSVILTIITYGFMFGFGTALAYTPPLGVAMRWFPRRKGLVNGVIVGGFGLGAFVFNQIQTFYLNPDNVDVGPTGYFEDDEILNRVPSTFLLLGSMYGVIQFLSIILITSPPSHLEEMSMTLVDESEDREEENEELLEETMSTNQEQLITNSESSLLMDEVKPRQVLRTKEFWILWGTFLLNTQAIGYINSMYKAYGQSFINDDHFLAVIGALAAVFNASGRVFWGHLCDGFGYRICIMTLSSLLAMFFVTLFFVGSKPLFACWIWGIFFCFCGNFVLLPTATAQCFGTRYLSKNYGLVMSGQAVGAPVLAILTQFVNPLVGWLGMFCVISAFCVTSCVLNFLFPKRPSPKFILDRLHLIPSHL